MIETMVAPAHVVAFRAAGKVKAEDYDNTMIPLIEDKLAIHDNISVLADLTEMENMSLGAIGRDLQYGLSKIGQMHHFKRVALITERQWIKGITTIVDKVFPNTEARVFSKYDRDDAMLWAAAFDN